MPEVANPIPAGVNEHAVLIARRNTLMSELLKIAPAINPPAPENVYKPSGKPKAVSKKPDMAVVTQKELKKIATSAEKGKEDAFADNPQLMTVNGVHTDLYDYIGINPDKATENLVGKMRYIHDWVVRQGKDFRVSMRKLNTIDNKLGSADIGEAKVLKLYNYLRLRNGNA